MLLLSFVDISLHKEFIVFDALLRMVTNNDVFFWCLKLYDAHQGSMKNAFFQDGCDRSGNGVENIAHYKVKWAEHSNEGK